MNWFLNRKISTKLLTSFLLIAILTAAVGIYGFISINRINNASTHLYKEDTLGIEYIGNISAYFHRLRYNSLETITLSNESEKEAAITKLNGFISTIDENVILYGNTIADETDSINYSNLKNIWSEYKQYIQQVIDKIKIGDYESAHEILIFNADTAVSKLMDQVDMIVNINDDLAEERSSNNDKTANITSVIMIIVICVSVIVAIVLGIYISNIISTPIKHMVNIANKLSLGDINIDVKATTKDEVGDLMHAFGVLVDSTRRQAELVEKIAEGDMTVQAEIRSDKDLLGIKLSEMLDKLNELLSNINNASEQVAAGSRQVSDSSVELSQGSTEQASSLEELTASVEQISSQTKHNADNAVEANRIAESAKSAAETGSEHMNKMLSAMDDINESSNNINKIIKVIDDIAFQTNILALNAAVEAARAGQHGKGFAVVAEEVRNLASKSANAAKETAALIEGSIKKVEGGTKIAASTSESLGEIVTGVAKVAKLVGDIAVASNEQASGIAQINQGLMQVSQVVQANSATSEESASASEELTSQADMLRRQVEKFKLRNTTVSYKTSDDVKFDIDMNSILETMQSKKRVPIASGASGKKSIHLNDNEYGKY